MNRQLFSKNNFDFTALCRISGTVVFITLFIYSIVYAKERTCYADSAWQFFERLNGEQFSFPSDRFGTVFSQLLFWTGVKFHLPLKMLVWLFSASYILLYYFVWRTCTFLLKNPAAGLVVVFGTLMGVRETFLHAVTESHQLIAFSALLFAVTAFNFQSRFHKYIFTCLITLLCLFTHPMAIFTIGFILLYRFAENKKITDPVTLILATIVIAGALINLLHPASQYDADQYNRLGQTASIGLFNNNPVTGFLTMHFTHFYWLPEFVGLLTAIAFIIRKEWFKFSILTLSVFTYLLIALATFRNGDSSMMLERIFLPAIFMINLCFAELLRTSKSIRTGITALLLSFIFVNGIRYINTGCLMYKKRLSFLDEIVKKGIDQGNQLYFLDSSDSNQEKLLMTWALGTESLIYSQLKYNKAVSLSIGNEPCPPGNCRLNSTLCFPVSELNPTYFKLEGKPYSELKTNP